MTKKKNLVKSFWNLVLDFDHWDKFRGRIVCSCTSYLHTLHYPIGVSSSTAYGADTQCIESGWGVLYDIIQGTEEWKGAETKFIQEVGTFWCIHFNIVAHTQTPHTGDLCHIWKQLHSCLTWPACTKWTLPTFLCVCCRGSSDPDTVAVGKWCVISQREHDSARLK